MRRIRVIPVLQIDEGRLVKSRRFADFRYLGDPINAVRIFNDKEVDELVLVDISATRLGRGPDFDHIERAVSEAFVPVAYGGGISRPDEIDRLFHLGVEKVIISSAAVRTPDLITEAARRHGGQSIVVCVNAKKKLLGGYELRIHGGRERVAESPADVAARMEAAGAGEIILVSIDRDGTFSGYDISLLRGVSSRVGIPVVACGGARSLECFVAAVRDGGCAAVAAGSLFAFQRQSRESVLINYPSPQALATGVHAML